MAWTCLATGLQPSEYKQLTRLEREAFKTQSHRMAAEMKRR